MALTTATQTSPYPCSPCLYMGIELSAAKWGLALSAGGGARLRRKGIVAVARKLLIAVWHLAEHGAVPKGAVIDLTESCPS